MFTGIMSKIFYLLLGNVKQTVCYMCLNS